MNQNDMLNNGVINTGINEASSNLPDSFYMDCANGRKSVILEYQKFMRELESDFRNINSLMKEPTPVQPTLITIYNAIKDVNKTPRSSIKELPLAVINTARYIDREYDPSGYVYFNLCKLKYLGVNSLSVKLILGDNDKVQYFHMYDQYSGEKSLYIMVNYMYYTQELPYDKYMRVTEKIIDLILSNLNPDHNRYESIIMTLQLMRDTSSKVKDLRKEIDDIFHWFFDDKSVTRDAIIELLENGHDLIKELLIDCGIYTLLIAGEEDDNTSKDN